MKDFLGDEEEEARKMVEYMTAKGNPPCHICAKKFGLVLFHVIGQPCQEALKGGGD